MKELNKTIGIVYSYALEDDWDGNLVEVETSKIHDTFNRTVTALTEILKNPNVSEKDKDYIKAKLDKLLD